jgi:transcriptional regulator GlxA family with amidase domain
MPPSSSDPEAFAHELAELARLRRARDRMDRAFEEPLVVPAIARTALMSPAHFSRRFRQEYGESPYSYLMTRRIERAMALLRRGDLTVTEICMAVGCTSLGSFSASFTKLVGLPPSVYRSLEHRDDAILPACVQRERTRPRPGKAPARSRAGSEKRTPNG